MNDPPPSVEAVAPEVPRRLGEVVRRAMAKDPDERYLSAGDLGRAATAGTGDEPVREPERTVATGAAAPMAQATRPAATAGRREGRASDDVPPTTAAAGTAALGGTGPGKTWVQPAREPARGPSAPPRRALVPALAALAALVLAAVLVVVLKPFGSTGPTAPRTTVTGNSTSTSKTTTTRPASLTRAAVDAALAAYGRAENAHDARGIAALLTADVVKVNGGIRYTGRPAALADYRCRIDKLTDTSRLSTRSVDVARRSATVLADYYIGSTRGGTISFHLVDSGGRPLMDRVTITLAGGRSGQPCR